MKLTQIIIAPLIVAIIFIGLGLYLGDGVTQYSSTQDLGHFNTTVDLMQDMFLNTSQTVNETTQTITGTSLSNLGRLAVGAVGTFIEFSGLFLGAGLQAIISTTQTLNFLFILPDALTADMSLGPMGGMIKTLVMTIILIIVIIGIVIAVATRSGGDKL